MLLYLLNKCAADMLIHFQTQRFLLKTILLLLFFFVVSLIDVCNIYFVFILQMPF